MRDLPLAVAPAWAVRGGLPAPDEGEGFRAYCSRIGLNGEVDVLLEGLEGRRLELANARLASYLATKMPDAFDSALNALYPRRDRPALDGALAERYN